MANFQGKLCGDVGEVEAPTTLPLCKDGVEYRPSNPVASDSDMAHMKPQNIIHADSSYMVKSTSKASSDCGLKKLSARAVACNISTERPNEPKEFIDKKKFCTGVRGNWHENAVVKGKTKYLWTDEVKNLPSGEKKRKFKGLPPVSSKPSVASDHNMDRLKTKCIIHADSSCTMKKNPKSGPSKHPEKLHPTRSGKTQNNISVQKVTDADLTTVTPLMSIEIIKNVNGDFQMNRSTEPCADGVNLTKDANQKHSDVGNVVFTIKEFYIKAAAEEPLHTDPSPVASWTGSFILKDEKTIIDFQAHPTSQGLSKVKEFSKKMPDVLEFELCSYKNFLRTVFDGCDPDDKDIGLYFFPDHRIRPGAYISHLERLSGNYFLRSCIDGVELLVFTSKVLHKDYRKRNKCDFLWGIYRRRHGKLKGVAVENMDIDAEEVDMEVDMICGEMVGPVDIIISKQSIESSIPPGFSPSMKSQWKMKIKEEKSELS